MRRSRSPLLLLTPLLAAACTGHSSGSLGPSQTLGVVAFETRLEIGTGVTRASSAVTFDLDGDGHVDIVAADAAGELAVRIGQGNGTFATGQVQPVSAGAFHVLPGDLDGDLDPDVVCVSLAGVADVLRNDGQGTLTPVATFSVGADPIDAQLRDLDGDGALDLVVVQLGATGLLQFAGVGDGSFRSPVVRTFDRSGTVTGLSIGDLDGDGRPEVVCCDVERGRIVVLPGDGTAPVLVPVGNQPVASAIGDLTADGTPEIAVAVLSDRAVVVLGRTGSGFAPLQTVATGGMPFDLLAADLDGDGAGDLAFTLLDRREVSVHLVSGQALASEPQTFASGGSPIQPQLADIDGDGIGDLFVPSFGADQVCVYRGNRAGFRGGRIHAIPDVPYPNVVAVADIDGNLVQDVIAVGFESTNVAISRFRGGSNGGVLDKVVTVDVGLRVQNVVPADLDGDNRVDLVVAVEGGIKLIHNIRPSSNFLYMFEVLPTNGVLAPGDGPFEVAVADLDADGALDLTVAYHAASKVALLRGTGVPFEFAAPRETAVPGMPVGLATGDFDGDGALEVAVGRMRLATISLLELGASGLELAGDTPVGAGPFYLRTADFDLDGRTDLVVSENGAARVSLLIASPQGGFRRVSLEAGSGPSALLARDLNRDGRPDILVASLAGADFRVLLGDGSGGVAQSLVFPGVYSAFSAAFVDADADGLEDLLIGSLDAAGLAVFKNVSRRE